MTTPNWKPPSPPGAVEFNTEDYPPTAGSSPSLRTGDGQAPAVEYATPDSVSAEKGSTDLGSHPLDNDLVKSAPGVEGPAD